MKKVSVIVPVYNVEKHVGKCLTELVCQTLEDIEILVVNDGSTDGSKEVIDAYAAQYPDKIKAFHIENRGAAGARNYALEHATGEYIGFVDSDDCPDRTMFEKLYNKAQLDGAQIVSCGYYRSVEGVGQKRGCFNYDCFGSSVYDEPMLIVNNLPYIWNKIFKRELVQQIGGFDNSLRIYEDLVFTYKLFLLANKISLVPEPLYSYTVNREESLTSVFSEKRFDVFQASDDLIRFYKDRNAFEYFEDELLFVVLKHIYVVLEKEVTAGSVLKKNKFINQAFSYLDKTFPWWRDYGYYYKRFKKKKKRYTSKFWWKSFFLLNQSTRKKLGVFRKGAKASAKVALHVNLGGEFQKHRHDPLNEKAAVIQSQHGNNLSGNMFYILRELSKEQYADMTLYVPYNALKRADFAALVKAYGFKRAVLVDINSAEYARVLATSKYLFNDTSFAAYFVKREGQVYLNTWHGTPLKTLGKSSIEDFFDIANLQKNFVSADYLLYPNEYTRDNMVRDYMLEGIFRGNILLSGYPRNEIFFDTARRAELKKKLKLEGKQVIAYMPTWRGNVRKVAQKKQINEIKGYLNCLDSSMADNQVLYVNFHPFVRQQITLDGYDNIHTFPAGVETYDFLNLADILITDYSSVMFDYALTGGKVILFTYDEEEYLGSRGLYLDFDKLPFTRVNTVQQLATELQNPEKPDISYVLDTFCRYDRADISAQLCRLAVGGETGALKTETLPTDRGNIFIFAGDALAKSTRTDRLQVAVEGAEKSEQYRYFVSYETDAVRADTQELLKLSHEINFMGQLRSYPNVSKPMMARLRRVFSRCNKKALGNAAFRQAFADEFERVFADIPMSGIVAWGDIGAERMYTLTAAPCKKILYLHNPREVCKTVAPAAFYAFDEVLTRNEETADAVLEYAPKAKVSVYGPCRDITKLEEYFG